MSDMCDKLGHNFGWRGYCERCGFVSTLSLCDEGNRLLQAKDEEIARLKKMLGRDEPVKCASCGQVRERSEVRCGQCSYMLDGSDADHTVERTEMMNELSGNSGEVTP
jgi:hypothetical protein